MSPSRDKTLSSQGRGLRWLQQQHYLVRLRVPLTGGLMGEGMPQFTRGECVDAGMLLSAGAPV